MKKTIIYFFVLLVLVSFAYAIVSDGDRDGVPDNKDNCSSSIGLVDIFGCDCEQKSGCNEDWCCEDNEFCVEYDFRAKCMSDLDGDGVFDIYDNCQNTSLGQVADNIGCSCLQKRCDDNNPCTDNNCNDETAKCSFVNNNNNICGVGKVCFDGFCLAKGYLDFHYYIYNSEKGELKIYYKHSAHEINVVFKNPLKEEIILLDSTSNILSYGLTSNRTQLNLVVEGDPDVEGVTTIKTTQEPVSVKMDTIEIPKREEKLSPNYHIWVYITTFFVISILFVVLILSQRKHEDKLLMSISKDEHKIGREVDLEAELQLKMYIITNLRRGYNAQQIRNELLRDGWRRDAVDRAFNSLKRR